MFDRSRSYGDVFGDGVSGARYMQDGHYYNNAGEYLFSNPGVSAPLGVSGVPIAVSVPQEGAESAPHDLPGGEPLTREQALNQMYAPELQQLQLVALTAMHPDQDIATLKKDLIRGTGAKQRLIEWLLAHTVA